ncbi:MAG TPA: hypothetical protein VF230_03480 [Acidimicrobiales bacterium]
MADVHSLEPVEVVDLEPAHGDSARHEPRVPRLKRASPRDPRARRARRAAVVLGMFSVASLGAATYVNEAQSDERDVRDLERAWRIVVKVDADRVAADQRVTEVATAAGDGTFARRERYHLHRAERDVLRELATEVAGVDADDGRLDALRAAMLRAIAERRELLRRSTSLANDETLTSVEARLDREMRRRGLERREAPAGTALHRATDLVNRLRAVTDADTTGLVLVARAGPRLHVVDVDRDHVSSHDLGEEETRFCGEMVGLRQAFAIVCRDRIVAFDIDRAGTPAWERPGYRAVVTASGNLWIQANSELTLVDSGGNALRPPVPAVGAELVATDGEEAVVFVTYGNDYAMTAGSALVPAPTPVESRRTGMAAPGNEKFKVTLHQERIVITPRNNSTLQMSRRLTTSLPPVNYVTVVIP